jgi:hypothetical protein
MTVKKENIDANNKSKKVKIVVAVVAVVVAIIVAIAVNWTTIRMQLIYNLIPDSIEATLGDEAVTIYKRKNSDYSRKNDGWNYVQFYFNDADGSEVSVNGDEELVYNGENYGVLYGDFLLPVLTNITHYVNIVKAIIAVVVILIVVGLIFLWFVLWSKKQDAEKEKKYGNKKKSIAKKK